MDNYFQTSDFNRSVRDIDFTMKAVQKIHKVVTARDFEDMEPERIFEFLLSEMEIVSFKDYLKRYIYNRIGINEPFRSIPNELYIDVIMDSFKRNQAPHSFTPTSVKWKTVVKRWLEQESVQRSTVFLLGFGLRMTEQDVSSFLTKVLKEEDINQYDPWEQICAYCFRNEKPYAVALEWKNWYEALSLSEEGTIKEEKELEFVCSGIKKAEEEMKKLLIRMKLEELKGNQQEVQQLIFQNLYFKCCKAIAESYQRDEIIDNGKKEWRMEDITPVEIEKILYDGVPQTENGNLQKMSLSLLGSQFQNKRISRQRLDQLLKGKRKVERYDLISLEFLYFSEQEDETDPKERQHKFIDEVNRVLEQCRMMTIYPVNPYEAFILMCLLTDPPLNAFNEVWEKSYGE